MQTSCKFFPSLLIIAAGLSLRAGNSPAPKTMAPTEITASHSGCAAGSAGECARLGAAMEQSGDYAAAFAADERGCTLGSLAACQALANGYEYSRPGIPRDFARARQFWLAACELRDGFSCTRAGDFMQIGRGLTKDFTQAAKLYRLSCELGFKPGCVFLGGQMLAGQGVAKDEAGAVKLFRAACDANVSEGCRWMATITWAGTGVEKDENLAWEYNAKACKLGDEQACDAQPSWFCQHFGWVRDIFHLD